RAVHEDDLIQLLKSLGIYEQIINGEYNCMFCEKVITLENLGAIFPDKTGKIYLICDEPSCFKKIDFSPSHFDE
ncbi:MAG: hypothetical protein ACTSQP_24520, partial [Promethearchaeota archaeon]